MIDAQTTIGSITLKVSNLDKVATFYQEIIGLHEIAHSAETVTLGTPTRPLIHLRHLPNGSFNRRGSGLYHLALRVPDRIALAQWLRRYVELKAPGWQGASDHGVSEALYLSDPEGNGIEIYCDRPQGQWQVASDGSITAFARPLDIQALLQSANGNVADSIDERTDMGHIHLRVSDIPVAGHFYVDLLGFGLKTALTDAALFVAAGDYHHHIGLNNWQSRGGADNSAETYGLDRFEICYPSAESRQQTINRLRDNQYVVTDDAQDLTICDPFQNQINLIIN